MASRLAAMLPAIADALPPPGTGSADARRSSNRARVRSAKRAASSTRPIVAQSAAVVAAGVLRLVAVERLSGCVDALQHPAAAALLKREAQPGVRRPDIEDPS